MSTGDWQAAAVAAERPQLVGLGYRLTGRVQVAEEIVQEAILRLWSQPERPRRPGAWLRTVVTRLGLDHLKSAAHRRETYLGPWLPEPWLAEGPEAQVAMAESVEMGLLVALEGLGPSQRAAWLLRDVFDEDYADIAACLGTSAANARQLVRRARARLSALRRTSPRQTTLEAERLAQFVDAVRQADLEGLQALLAEDVESWSDGGGVASAARVVIRSRTKVALATVKLARLTPSRVVGTPAWVNGGPGVVLFDGDSVYAVVCLSVDDGQVTRIWTIRNPHKLAHVAARTLQQAW